jgi:hypothetical protein
VTTRVRAIDSGKLTEEETTSGAAESLVSASEYFSEVINHGNADVRKCCVFCLVEIHSALSRVDKQLFHREYLSKLNPSQQKLVEIYIKRKLDQQDNKGPHCL